MSHLFYKDFLERIFSEIRYGKLVRRLNGYIVLFDRLVVSFENLFYERERFLNDLKPVYRETYDKMESYWNLGNDYASIQRTISICKESVERKISVFSNKIQNRQSNILFFLAIVQIFSVLSIATDYFSFVGINVIKEYVQEYSFVRNYGLVILTAITLLALFTSYYEKIFNELAYLISRINHLLKRRK